MRDLYVQLLLLTDGPNRRPMSICQRRGPLISYSNLLLAHLLVLRLRLLKVKAARNGAGGTFWAADSGRLFCLARDYKGWMGHVTVVGVV